MHDSSGLPYVEDRLLSYVTKTLDRTANNPLIDEYISSHRFNPAWDHFPTALSVAGVDLSLSVYKSEANTFYFVLTPFS